MSYDSPVNPLQKFVLEISSDRLENRKLNFLPEVPLQMGVKSDMWKPCIAHKWPFIAWISYQESEDLPHPMVTLQENIQPRRASDPVGSVVQNGTSGCWSKPWRPGESEKLWNRSSQRCVFCWSLAISPGFLENWVCHWGKQTKF